MNTSSPFIKPDSVVIIRTAKGKFLYLGIMTAETDKIRILSPYVTAETKIKVGIVPVQLPSNVIIESTPFHHEFGLAYAMLTITESWKNLTRDMVEMLVQELKQATGMIRTILNKIPVRGDISEIIFEEIVDVLPKEEVENILEQERFCENHHLPSRYSDSQHKILHDRLEELAKEPS